MMMMMMMMMMMYKFKMNQNEQSKNIYCGCKVVTPLWNERTIFLKPEFWRKTLLFEFYYYSPLFY